MAIEDDLNEAEQVEQLFTWWKENWAWLLSGVAIGLLVLIGWFWWTGKKDASAEQAGLLYRQLVAASDRNDFGRMEGLKEQIDKDYASTPYADQGRLLVARMYVETGEYEKATALLRQVADGAKDVELRAVAQVRLARVLIQMDKPDEAIALLKADATGAFTAIQQDVRGDAYFAKGDMEAARVAYAAALAAAPALSPDERQIVELKLQDLAAEAGATAPAQEQAAK
ncbi:MAG: tetratricopeptide repeat protein [Steroidobacteraceae bacterium]